MSPFGLGVAMLCGVELVTRLPKLERVHCRLRVAARMGTTIALVNRVCLPGRVRRRLAASKALLDGAEVLYLASNRRDPWPDLGGDGTPPGADDHPP